MKKVILPLVLALAALSLDSCGKPVDQDFNFDDTGNVKANPYPNVVGGDVKGEKNFAFLLNTYTSGKPKRTPWAGYWWPYKENGISSGTFGEGGSPAGKYDAARGGQTNAQAWESRFHGAGVKGVQGWWGHCNGWCAAAALYDEPNAPVTVNGITFGIADIKALLSEAGMNASADFFGNRVDWASDYNTPKADDVVPDQYFLVLTNYMGKLGHDVLIDRHTAEEIWNQPLGGYRFDYPTPQDYLGQDPDHPGIYKINVTSTIWWMRDDVDPAVQTPDFDFPGDDTDTVQQRTLKMEVWLDGPVVFDGNGKITSSGNVIVTRQGQYFFGGAWKMGGFSSDLWPDYMWVPYSLSPSTDPNDDTSNPQVDIRWIEQHLLVPGGADDPSAHPQPVVSPPPVSPSSTPSPNPTPTDTPQPTPTSTSTGSPWWPFPGPTSTATSTPDPGQPQPGQPQPTPTSTSNSPTWPFPLPWPFPGHSGRYD